MAQGLWGNLSKDKGIPLFEYIDGKGNEPQTIGANLVLSIVQYYFIFLFRKKQLMCEIKELNFNYGCI